MTLKLVLYYLNIKQKGCQYFSCKFGRCVACQVAGDVSKGFHLYIEKYLEARGIRTICGYIKSPEHSILI